VIERALNVAAKDSLFDPDRPGENIAYVRRSSGSRPLYRVFLYLDGLDLPFVKSATYRLHETFKPSTRTVTRSLSNPKCKLEIWTWGVFTVSVSLEDRQGRLSTLSHHLEYARHISDPNVEYRTT
jgi:hypothetical protein